jgi:hypothetical protein
MSEVVATFCTTAHDNLGILAAMTPEVRQLAERDALLVERNELRALVAKQFQDLDELRQQMADMRQRTTELGREFERIRRLLRDRDLLAAELAANRHPLEWDRN